MIGRAIAVAVTLIGGMLAAPADAQVRFPRVYGPTGRPYGPTLAHYQYQRQYGRPWHGYGGFTANFAPVSTVAYVGGAPWWGFYGRPYVAAPYYMAPPVVVPQYFAPGLSFYSPGVIGGYGVYGTPGTYWPFPDYSLVQPGPAPLPLQDAWQENLDRWGPALTPAKPDPVTLPVQPSTPEAQLKSLRSQAQGDEHLRQQQWLSAYNDYKRAVQYAPDRAEAYFRQGLALVALQKYEQAAFSFKRALALDPLLPQIGTDLDTIFGHGSDIARNSIMHEVTQNASADIRDPDRLFLLGVMMHFSHDSRANEVFDAGYRLAGRGQHFLAFLKLETKVAKPAEPEPPTSANPALPPAPPPEVPGTPELPTLPPPA